MLGKLSACYVAAGSAYALAVVLWHHPEWTAAAQRAAHRGPAAVVALYDHALDARHAPGRVRSGPARPPASMPSLAQTSAPSVSVAAQTPQTTVTLDIVPLPPAVLRPQPSPRPAPPGAPSHRSDLARAEQRLKDGLTRQLYANFDLFLYVSKATDGPLAQHMYVFTKTKSGGLRSRFDWPVSTGRDRMEDNDRGRRLSTFTPVGYYELDPTRMYRHYRSAEWGKRMPYAMFFNWVHDGRRTGLAIHAAEGADIALLGERASGGCIHLSPRNAGILFRLIRAGYRGEVPRFAYDRKTETMNNHGRLMRGRNGKLRYFRGYKVLIYIENYGGKDGENVVAALM